ncbi:MAG: hypothetical protein AB7V46_04260 [Thermomicrobiales bacterium]
MNDQNQQVNDTEQEEGGGPLGQILSTELGDPSPIEKYHRPLDPKEREQLESELKAVEEAQAEAASQLPNLYAG